MKRKHLFALIMIVTLGFGVTSCFQDLDLEPPYGLNASSVYEDPDNYINVLAKIYGGFAMSGNQGPAGNPDISGIDEGFSQYIRVLWNLQELPTDEAVCGWNDPGIPELNYMTWVSTNTFANAMYFRIYFQITMINEFMREAAVEKLEDRGFEQADIDRIQQYRSEARFLRALSYYHALDLFGSVPFITEEDPVGAFFPEQISRTDLFNYVEQELLDVESALIDPIPGFDPEFYGRASKAAVWTLLAKLYLNAEVYTGTARYADAAQWARKVIDEGGYTLDDDYADMFQADNHTSTEIIFPITHDGLRTQTYGGTTFLTHAPVGGSMNADDFGVNVGWAGYRTTRNLFELFLETDTANDSRAMFYTDGQTLDISELGTFQDGFGITKWRNLDDAGNQGSDQTGNFVDTDYPLFRLADVYLIYAECAARGAGDVSLAVDLVNDLRERAFTSNPQTIVAADLTPQFVLEERARELYWEAHRRTDLIRYDQYTGGNYVWPLKGADSAGVAVEPWRDLYPIPEADVTANPNLVQNEGYQ